MRRAEASKMEAQNVHASDDKLIGVDSSSLSLGRAGPATPAGISRRFRRQRGKLAILGITVFTMLPFSLDESMPFMLERERG